MGETKAWEPMFGPWGVKDELALEMLLLEPRTKATQGNLFDESLHPRDEKGRFDNSDALRKEDPHGPGGVWEGQAQHRTRYGVVVMDGDKVLLREPANHFEGFHWTFARGGADEGEHPVDTARREGREELGHDIGIEYPIPQLFRGGNPKWASAYYMAHSKGEVGKPDWETASTRWVGYDEARKLIQEGTNAPGVKRDLEVLDAAFKKGKAKGITKGEAEGHEFHGNQWTAGAGSTREEKVARIKELVKQLKPLMEKEYLTAGEADQVERMTSEVNGHRFDITSKITPGRVAENIAKAGGTAQQNTMTPETIAVAQHDLLRNKEVFLAVTKAATGSWFDRDTPVDDILNGRNPSVSAERLRETFKGTRDALRKQYGDSVPAFRATGMQKEKATQNWATTREFAENFGKNIVERDIPVDSIQAVNVGLRGTYHELIVDSRKKAKAKGFDPDQERDASGRWAGGRNPDALEWVQPKRARGEEMIEVSTRKLDALWKTEPGFRIDEAGSNKIGSRMERFGQWLASTAVPIETPEIGPNAYGGIGFTDGRHRFAYLRDRGVETVKVSVPKREAAKVRALLAKTKGFNPDQERDELGRWAAGAGAELLNPSNAHERGVITDAVTSGRFTTSVTTKTDYQGPAYHITLTPALPPGAKMMPKQWDWEKDEDRARYDPAIATPDADGRLTLKPGWSDNAEALAADSPPDSLYRGMSAEEFRSIVLSGKVESHGGYNLGEKEIGKTFYTIRASQAESYASGFQPWSKIAAHGFNAYIIETRDPDRPGTIVRDEERGVPGSIAASEITAIYEGVPYRFRPGKVEYLARTMRTIHGDVVEHSEGSRSSPNTAVAWRKLTRHGTEWKGVFEQITKDFKEEDHPRGADGKWVDVFGDTVENDAPAPEEFLQTDTAYGHDYASDPEDVSQHPGASPRMADDEYARRMTAWQRDAHAIEDRLRTESDLKKADVMARMVPVSAERAAALAAIDPAAIAATAADERLAIVAREEFVRDKDEWLALRVKDEQLRADIRDGKVADDAEGRKQISENIDRLKALDQKWGSQIGSLMPQDIKVSADSFLPAYGTPDRDQVMVDAQGLDAAAAFATNDQRYGMQPISGGPQMRIDGVGGVIVSTDPLTMRAAADALRARAEVLGRQEVKDKVDDKLRELNNEEGQIARDAMRAKENAENQAIASQGVDFTHEMAVRDDAFFQRTINESSDAWQHIGGEGPMTLRFAAKEAFGLEASGIAYDSKLGRAVTDLDKDYPGAAARATIWAGGLRREYEESQQEIADGFTFTIAGDDDSSDWESEQASEAFNNLSNSDKEDYLPDDWSSDVDYDDAEKLARDDDGGAEPEILDNVTTAEAKQIAANGDGSYLETNRDEIAVAIDKADIFRYGPLSDKMEAQQERDMELSRDKLDGAWRDAKNSDRVFRDTIDRIAQPELNHNIDGARQTLREEGYNVLDRASRIAEAGSGYSPREPFGADSPLRAEIAEATARYEDAKAYSATATPNPSIEASKWTEFRNSAEPLSTFTREWTNDARSTLQDFNDQLSTSDYSHVTEPNNPAFSTESDREEAYTTARDEWIDPYLKQAYIESHESDIADKFYQDFEPDWSNKPQESEEIKVDPNDWPLTMHRNLTIKDPKAVFVPNFAESWAYNSEAASQFGSNHIEEKIDPARVLVFQGAKNWTTPAGQSSMGMRENEFILLSGTPKFVKEARERYVRIEEGKAKVRTSAEHEQKIDALVRRLENLKRTRNNPTTSTYTPEENKLAWQSAQQRLESDAEALGLDWDALVARSKKGWRASFTVDIPGAITKEFDESLHPRGGNEASPGQFSDAPGGEGAGGASKIADEPTTHVANPHRPDVEKDSDGDGVTDASRVGVPADEVPPPPTVPRLPNLTPEERAEETAFANAFEADPDGMATEYLDMVKAAGEPPVFETDGAKNLVSAWNGENGDVEARALYRSTMNVALHQTANAIAKRAFLIHLSEMSAEDKAKGLLVTVGGCGAGKGYSLKMLAKAGDAAFDKTRYGAVWDSAGDQNATENPWLLSEASSRGIHTTYAYVSADPEVSWADEGDPKTGRLARGVVSRAVDTGDGRMVDANVFTDSYVIGAHNHDYFSKNQQENPLASFVFTRDGKRIAGVPESDLNRSRRALHAFAVKTIKSRSGLLPRIKRGALVGERIWHA